MTNHNLSRIHGTQDVNPGLQCQSPVLCMPTILIATLDNHWVSCQAWNGYLSIGIRNHISPFDPNELKLYKMINLSGMPV